MAPLAPDSHAYAYMACMYMHVTVNAVVNDASIHIYVATYHTRVKYVPIYGNLSQDGGISLKLVPQTPLG